MPSFSKTSVFPAGYFRATSAWLLRERRDVVARLTTLGAEMTRIGFVTMHYRKIKQGESTLATEQRMGFSVTAGSSLARLVQAYIATGGNPFNISGFLHPETSSFEAQADGDVAVSQDYPGGGVYSAMSAEYNEPHVKSTAEVSPSGDVVSVGDSDANETDPEADEGEVPKQADQTGYEGYPGGYVGSSLGPSHRYFPARQGGRVDRGAWDHATVHRAMEDIRKWANKEIRARLQDKEWRIIKLSDCWEQLRMERDFTLMEAFAGQLDGLPVRDDLMVDPQRLCQNVIADMYALLYDVDESGLPTGFKPNPGLGLLYFAIPDVPEDMAGPMA